MTNRVAQRRARVALTASALVILTISGHTAGGGSVDLLGLVLVAGLSLGVALSTRATPLSLPRLLTVLVAGQALLHLVLTFTSGHAAHGMASPPPTAMIAGHAGAALVAALVVRHADGLVARWLAFVSTVLGARATAVMTMSDASPSAPASSGRGLPHLETLLHDVVRRGPPAGMHLLPA